MNIEIEAKLKVDSLWEIEKNFVIKSQLVNIVIREMVVQLGLKGDI